MAFKATSFDGALHIAASLWSSVAVGWFGSGCTSFKFFQLEPELTNTLAEQQTEQTRKTIQPFYFVVSGIKLFLNLVGRSWKPLTSLLTDCQWLTRHLRVFGYIGLANVHAADCPFRSLLFQPKWKGPHCPVTAGIAPNTRTCLLALFWPRLQTFGLDSQLQQFADPASCTVNGNYWNYLGTIYLTILFVLNSTW